MSSLGERLSELMNRPENKDKDAEYLAKVIGTERQYIYKLKNDTLKQPDNYKVKQLAEELGSTFDYLVFGENKPHINMLDTDLVQHLPEDLQEFILNDDNKPFIVFAKQLKNYDIDNISQSDMDFLISALQMHYQKHKNKSK